MIEKEFIPYELALELKQLRFNEPCLSYFDSRLEQQLGNFDFTEIEVYKVYNESASVLVPTFSQAFRFFRQKGYIVNIVCDAENVNHRYMFDIFYDIQLKYSGAYEVDTYEQTELECLKKLIELIKKGNK
jgi:hypothetical protein